MDGNPSPRVTRRDFLAATAATALAAGSVSAAEKEKKEQGMVKGPIVWLDMDQKELDDAYDQSVYAPNQGEIRKRRAAARWSRWDSRWGCRAFAVHEPSRG